MRLGNRLMTIAAKIEKGMAVADIGTDHAQLPIYLVTEGISKRVIATDIITGPYERARENIEKFCLQDFIQLRLGPGLTPIKAGEADVAVIAGMGGLTIINIIDESRDIADSFKKLILQPMRHQAKLREFLFSIGYQITDEDVAVEGNRFYEIMVVQKAGEVPCDEIDVLVGPVLRHKKTPEVYKYFCSRIEKLQAIIRALDTVSSPAGKKSLLELSKEFQALKEVMK